MSEFPWTDETNCAHEHADAAEAEVRRLRAELAEAQAQIKHMQELRLVRAGPGERGFDIVTRGEFLPVLAEMMAQQFIDSGGKNYVEMEVQAQATGPLTLTMQRRHGKTPAQIASEARADRDALAAKLSEARSLCYRASRSDMLPAEILGELAGIVGDGDDG